jgi:hypothetical protein
VKSYFPGFSVKAGCFPVGILLSFFDSQEWDLSLGATLQGDWAQVGYHPFLYWKSLHYQLPLLTPNRFFLEGFDCVLFAWLLAALLVLVLVFILVFLSPLPLPFPLYSCIFYHACHTTATTITTTCCCCGFSTYITPASPTSCSTSEASST